MPTELSVEPVEGVLFGPVRYPAAEEKRFDWSPVVLRVYGGTIQLQATVEVATDAPTGPRLFRCRLSYQGCTPSACLMPSSQTVEAELEVGA